MAPRKNYIPKEATQQNEFLKKYPEYDGRGIKIAIMDSDIVDNGLPGFQKTSDGLPKINEWFGKPMVPVETSKIVERSDKDFIVGLTGRRLIIPSKWKNPSDKWHLGKVQFDRIFDYKEERGDEKFLKEFEKNPKFKETFFSLDKGIMMDCIVWFDGKKWQGCIDNSLLNGRKTWKSDLGNASILTDFENKYEFACLIDKSNFKNSSEYLIDIFTYCINIHDDGNSLQIKSPYNGHASIVSHVAAAYFSDNLPESNGSAPGAQIVSINGGGVCEERNLRYLEKCIELKIDVLNVSTFLLLTPSIIQTIKKMVEEHGIIITHAAANDGPLFSSIPDQLNTISDEIFIIGSFVAPEMIKRYDLSESENSIAEYSSKGPFLSSGARGVDFVAPGTVITDLPKWYPNKNTIAHGTSNAAPNVAGSIACLLSALKANGIPYSPAMIKMALANTAFLPKGANKLEFGNGIIQINDAFEFIKKFYNILPQKLLIPTFCIDESKHEKGIIFVKNENNNLSQNYCVNINPKFDKKWILKCTLNDQSFVTHSETVSGNNSFKIKIDANLLKEGSINYAEIYGIDSLNPAIGPLFYLPITVICPAESLKENIITVEPNSPFHFFIAKPLSSDDSQQFCQIKITALDDEKESGIILKYLEDNYCSGICSREKTEHVLEFTKTKNFNILNFDVKHFKENFFEISIYANVSISYKLEIDFSKTVI